MLVDNLNKAIMKDRWAEKILARFEGREDLGKKLLFEKYFKTKGLNQKEVMECFDEIELIYCIPVGVLRPKDNMTKLTEAISTYNPLQWWSWRPRSEFADAELMIELGIKLKKHGTFHLWKMINTFEDFVLAWCGEKP